MEPFVDYLDRLIDEIEENCAGELQSRQLVLTSRLETAGSREMSKSATPNLADINRQQQRNTRASPTANQATETTSRYPLLVTLDDEKNTKLSTAEFVAAKQQLSTHLSPP